MRAHLGTRARVRFDAGRGFHLPAAKKDRRSSSDSHRPPRWLHDLRVIIDSAVGSKNGKSPMRIGREISRNRPYPTLVCSTADQMTRHWKLDGNRYSGGEPIA